MYRESQGIPFGLISKIAGGVFALVLLIAAFSAFGVNDAGYRTVVQRPNGEPYVVRQGGAIYFDAWGKSTAYPDVLTYQFDEKTMDNTGLATGGVEVRYQDGGTGHVYGTIRAALPISDSDMLEMHREFGSPEAVMESLVEKVTDEALNLTAGLMTSEEGYAEKRNQFIEWATDQVENGKYQTNLVPKLREVEPAERAPDGTIIREAVTRTQNVPEIRLVNGIAARGEAQFLEYGVNVKGMQLIDWTFEPKTLAQISQKREAEMAIITSQSNAAKANQERLQAIAEGEKNVAEARYREEVIKAAQLVVAEREKEVAEINASRAVEVNRQNYLAKQQDVLAAEQEAIAQRTRAGAEADARTLLLEADGALAQKLATFERVNQMYADALGKHRLTPDLVMGGTDGATTEGTVGLVDLLTAKTARDLALDLQIKE